MNCAEARRVGVCRVCSSSVVLFLGTAPVAGTDSDQRGGSGMRHGKTGQVMSRRGGVQARSGAKRHVSLWLGNVGRGLFINCARVGTGPDQRRRRGMKHGSVSCGSVSVGNGWAGSARALRVASVFGNHHAAGAVPASTPDGGMHRGMVRRVDVGNVALWRVMARIFEASGNGKGGCNAKQMG